MRLVFGVWFLVFGVHHVLAQGFDHQELTVNGLKIFSEKEQIIKVLGKPSRAYDPEYECGFLSSDEQEKPFETLDYGGLKYTGTKGEDYVAEEIPIADHLNIQYKGRVVKSAMNLDQLVKIFGEDMMNRFHDAYSGRWLFTDDTSDDGFIFEMKEGKLVKIEYWSPC